MMNNTNHVADMAHAITGIKLSESKQQAENAKLKAAMTVIVFKIVFLILAFTSLPPSTSNIPPPCT